MRTADLDYRLPPDRIATEPAQPRDAARLMVVYREQNRVEHHRVRDLPDLSGPGENPAGLLRAGDLLVYNQTRVIPARFIGRRAATGGSVQGLFLQEPTPSRWLVMLEARGTLRPGETIILDSRASLALLGHASSGEGDNAGPSSADPIHGGEWVAALQGEEDTYALLHRLGTSPLPPYIRRQRRALQQPEVRPDDAAHYNTIYAETPGSVAAPTAGLHFTPELLDRLAAHGIQRAALTLHVGAGTFAPIRTERIEQHAMHTEWFSVPAATLAAMRRTRAAGGRIIPVGTTSVRALESVPDPLPAETDGGLATTTALLISPGFSFRFTDALLTNFHLPRSTLLALVAALPGVGVERLLGWYQIAVTEGYRFYSYGDAMLLV